MDGEAPLAIGGKIRAELLFSWCTTHRPPAGGTLTHHDDQRGVTQGYPLMVFLYILVLLSLAKSMRVAVPGSATAMVCGLRVREGHI